MTSEDLAILVRDAATLEGSGYMANLRVHLATTGGLADGPELFRDLGAKR